MSIPVARTPVIAQDVVRGTAIAVPAWLTRLRRDGTYPIVAAAFTLVGAIGAIMLLAAVRTHVAGDALGLVSADPMHPYVGKVIGDEGAYLWSPAIIQAAAP